MPSLKFTVPKLRKHVSGRAVVTLAGRDHYLGSWGSGKKPTVAVQNAYDAKIAEWLASGRPGRSKAINESDSLATLLVSFLKHAKLAYGTEKKASRYFKFKQIAKTLRPYAETSLEEFGPLPLKGIRQRMIDEGLCRTTINQNIGSIKQIFKWGVSEQLVPVAAYQALCCVTGLRAGFSNVKEAKTVQPVAREVVDKTLPFLPPHIQDMVRLQLILGCRPSEICNLKVCDVDQSATPWEVTLKEHKNAHRNKYRTMYFGPKARGIVCKYLVGLNPDDAVFSPQRSEEQRLAEKSSKRVTPKNQGNKPGYTSFTRSRRRIRRREANQHYDRCSYARAISRACEKAFPAPEGFDDEQKKSWKRTRHWSPNQIRHLVASEVRKMDGLELAGLVLGHSQLSTTQIYAERDLQRLRATMEAKG